MLRLMKLAGAAAVSALIGCGGGESGENDAVCSDFRYQEDAQAAYLSGARQLDRDSDGVACEDLPRRPVSGGGGGSGSGGSPTTPPAVAYNLMTSLGEVIALEPASAGRYVMSVWGPFGSVVDAGPLSSSASTTSTQVANSFIGVRYGASSGELVPVWSNHGDGLQGGAGGIGFAQATRSVPAISGIYRAIGQSCQQGRAPCTPITGTLVMRDGTLSICMNQDATVSSCTATIALPVTRADSDPEGIFTLGHLTARLLVSASGSVAVSYQNVYESVSNPNPTFTRTTWFGTLQGQESQAPLGTTAFEGFVNAGVPAYSVANSWTLQDNLPFSRLRRDPAGRLALRGINGQLVTWSPEGGLQVFVQR